MRKPLAQALYLTRQHYRRTVPSGVNNNRIIHVLSFGFDRTWWRLFQRTWWMLFQKRVVRTKLDIYVFIVFILSINSPIQQLIADNILISFGNINFKTVAISRIWYAYTPDASEFTSGCCPSLALLPYFVFIRLLSPPHLLTFTLTNTTDNPSPKSTELGNPAPLSSSRTITKTAEWLC